MDETLVSCYSCGYTFGIPEPVPEVFECPRCHALLTLSESDTEYTITFFYDERCMCRFYETKHKKDTTASVYDVEKLLEAKLHGEVRHYKGTVGKARVYFNGAKVFEVDVKKGGVYNFSEDVLGMVREGTNRVRIEITNPPGFMGNCHFDVYLYLRYSEPPETPPTPPPSELPEWAKWLIMGGVAIGAVAVVGYTVKEIFKPRLVG